MSDIESKVGLDITEWEPLGERLIVKSLEPKTQTKGGILLPGIAQEKSKFAEVLVSSIAGIGVGDIVMHHPFGGVDMKVDDVDYLVLRSEDLMLRRRSVSSGPQYDNMANEGEPSTVSPTQDICEDDQA